MDGFLPAHKWLGILLSQELPRNSFNIGRLQMKLQKAEVHEDQYMSIILKIYDSLGEKSKLPGGGDQESKPKMTGS